ncbi:MAG: CBS domain-containing protein [Nanoarchaeota archaeon]|nr:CBS domain-containing protein [Nanoarchaeota archaeon]
MKVKEVMKKAIVIDKDITLARASKIISSKNISSLIFIKNNKVAGLITKEDIIKKFGKNIKVSKVMSRNIIKILADDKIESAIEIMKKNKISVLPVVNEKKELVGIVAVKDLLSVAGETGDFLFD